MNRQQLCELIKKHSKPEEATNEGMVYQVWEDGEVTLQKSGDLLWQRSLHMIHAGLGYKRVPLTCFPEQYQVNHAFVFTDAEGAGILHRAIMIAQE